jgi:hypothetical protein
MLVGEGASVAERWRGIMGRQGKVLFVFAEFVGCDV